MVRITPELVENAPQYTNAVKDRELDLRGYKFPVIENLGSTLDQFDTIDLSENEIRKLDGFPLLKRLRSLILTNNKLMRLADDLGQQVPNLDTLILTGNSFSELRELEPLSTCRRLTFLSLLHCPVTNRSNYRLFVISRVPTIRFLDYRRVTNSERKLANSMFRRLPALSTPTPKAAPKRVVNGIVRAQQPAAAKTFVPGAPLNQATTLVEQKESMEVGQPAAAVTTKAPTMPPPATSGQAGAKRPATGGSTQDLFAIQEAIKRARTMEEVERLHQMLSSGQFAGFASYWQQQRQQQSRQAQQQQEAQQSETSVQQQQENQDSQAMELSSEGDGEQSATELQPQPVAQAAE